jgi:hypothetical protein
LPVDGRHVRSESSLRDLTQIPISVLDLLNFIEDKASFVRGAAHRSKEAGEEHGILAWVHAKRPQVSECKERIAETFLVQQLIPLEVQLVVLDRARLGFLPIEGAVAIVVKRAQHLVHAQLPAKVLINVHARLSGSMPVTHCREGGQNHFPPIVQLLAHHGVAAQLLAGVHNDLGVAAVVPL